MDGESQTSGQGWWRNMPLGCRAEFHACVRRICSWPIPPNWGRTEWVEEICAVAAEAACEAESQFDPSHGVSVHAFVHSRVLGRSLSRYRQEWAFSKRCLCVAAADPDADTHGKARVFHDPAGQQNPVCDGLLEAVAQLSEPHRWLIEALFWQERTEADIGCELGISQRAVSKRKHVVLRSLAQWMKTANKNFTTKVLKVSGHCNL